MPVYRTGDRWRYEFDRYIDGRRQRTTKLLPKGWTRAQAESYARKQDAELWGVATGAIKREPLIAEAVLLYLKERAPSLKYARVDKELERLLPWYEGKRLSQLHEVASAYMASAQVKPATTRNRIAYLRAACRYAFKRGLGEHDPAERLVMPKVSNERHVYLTRKQVLQACRKMTNREARKVCLVAFYSGMRLGEILSCRVDGGWLSEDTKNGERRLVPIHHKVAHLARQWPPAVSARTVYTRWTAACREIGLHGVTVHTLRHSAASAMINSGASLYEVGAVLGHKTPISTKRYSHLATSTLEAAVRKIA